MVNAFMKIHNGKKAKLWAGSILPIQRCDSFIELSFGPICLFFPQRTSAQFYCARFILLWIIVTQSGIRVSLCATSTINHRKNGPLFFVLFSRRMMLVPWFSLFFFFVLHWWETLANPERKVQNEHCLEQSYFYRILELMHILEKNS